jgi:ammonium transporter, Amt family
MASPIPAPPLTPVEALANSVAEVFGDYGDNDDYDGAVAGNTNSPGYGDLNIMFILFSGYLVFLMQAGFGMISAGLVRSKNAKAILIKNMMDACLGAIVFYSVGFAFAYGGKDNGNQFIGSKYFFLGDGIYSTQPNDDGVNQLQRNPMQLYDFFFQWAFAAAAATIVSGALAERASFISYMVYAVMLIGFVYPVVVFWVWSGYGWLSVDFSETSYGGPAVRDFAGSGVVHATGGMAAFWGAFVLGPRMGRYDAAGKPVEIPGHNASLQVLGTFLLWVGWYGFNPGSALRIVGFGQTVALCAVNTTLGGAAGGVFAMFWVMMWSKIKTGTTVWDIGAVCNGALGGLVAVTANCNQIYPWSAIIIGGIGGVICMGSAYLNAHYLRVDDPLDAVAVHGACGYWGVFATGLFSFEAGGFFGYGGQQLGTQCVFILAHFAWVTAIMLPFWFILKKLGIFRVSPEVEMAGADASYHGGSAYPKEMGLEKTGNGAAVTDALASQLKALADDVSDLKAKMK